MAQTTLTYLDATGATQTLEASEGASYKIPNNRIVDATGHFLPTMDAAARAGYVSVTDGTDTLGINDIDGVLDERLDQYAMTVAGLMAIDAAGSAGSQLVPLNVVSTAAPWLKVALYNSTNAMPAMDAAARRGYVQLTDGTDSMAIEKVDAALSETAVTSIRTIASLFALDSGAGAGSQAIPLEVVTTTPNLKVSVLNGTNVMPAADAVARSLFAQLSDATTGPVAVKAASTGAALVDKALVVSVNPSNASTIGHALDQDDTVTAIKASAGVLKRLTVVNNQAAITYIQLFDVASGSVVVGTTEADWQIAVPASVTQHFELDVPFATAISVAATTTFGGATGSNNGVALYWTRY